MPKGTDDRPLPNHATFYVAHAVANDVLVKLAYSLCTNFVFVTGEDRELRGADILAGTLERFVPAADFKPQHIADTLTDLGPYDPDEAESMAIEIVGEAIAGLRKRFVG